MASAKLGRLELKVMDALWRLGTASVREIQEQIRGKPRPAYTTVQTVVSRLEAKGAVRRTKKVGNAHIFEPVLKRESIHRRVADDLLSLFGGGARPLISHLVETGQLTLDDIDDAREMLRAVEQQKGERKK